jgi:hypothetical protein
MTFLKDDIVRYRLEKAQVTFNEAKSLANNGVWNGAANRLYYRVLQNFNKTIHEYLLSAERET